MIYKITYLDEAKKDIKKAKAWYKKERNGLQKQFANEVIKAISRLEKFPPVFAIRYRNIRIVHNRTFPYGIHFYIDEKLMNVTITAIVHDYRDVEEFIGRA
jgi:plasmid stabilization system protein ParE